MIQRCLEVCLVREFLWQPALLELSALPNHSSSWKDLSSGLFVVLHQCLLSLVWFLLVVNVHDLIVLNTLSVLWCQTKLCFLKTKIVILSKQQLTIWFITKMASGLKMRKTICICFSKGRDLLLSCWLLGLLHLLEQGGRLLKYNVVLDQEKNGAYTKSKNHQEVRLLDSLGFLGLYLAYILVVLVGRFIHNRNRVDLPYAGFVVVFVLASFFILFFLMSKLLLMLLFVVFIFV